MTLIMIEEIKALLDKKENINKYLISKQKDLIDYKKINLY